MNGPLVSLREAQAELDAARKVRPTHCGSEVMARDYLAGRALPNLLTLEALARDEHDQRCGCTGEACKLGEVLRVLES